MTEYGYIRRDIINTELCRTKNNSETFKIYLYLTLMLPTVTHKGEMNLKNIASDCGMRKDKIIKGIDWLESHDYLTIEHIDENIKILTLNNKYTVNVDL